MSPDLPGSAARISASPRHTRAAVNVGVIATALALFFSAQIYYSSRSFGHPVGWAQALYWGFGDWYEWALLSPAIFWLSARFHFDRRSWPRSTAVHLLSGVTFSIVHAAFCAGAAVLQAKVTGPAETFLHAWRGLLGNRAHFNLAVYAMIVCAWHAWDYHRRFREREADSALLTQQLAQAQLQALRMQLQPHFLFNALNAVSSLMLIDVTKANKMLARLSELLRLTLDGSSEQIVPLRQELEFLRRYLDIEEIRFGDRLQASFAIEPQTLDAKVPNLILQPLVENAIRHAIQAQPGSGHLVVRSVISEGSLLLQVQDNGPGLADSNLQSRERSGIGLQNTRQRLQRLYSGAGWLRLSNAPGGGVLAQIALPFTSA